MTRVFMKYGDGRGEPPACVVSHTDAGGPCPRPAIGEVWSLPFYGLHGREAELAAKFEIEETTERELQVLADAEYERYTTNRYVLAALKAAKAPYDVDVSTWEAAIARAYPPDDLEPNTDPDTLGFNYDRDYPGDGPVDWWSDAQLLVCRFMREAEDRGLVSTLPELEALRERATVQMMLAERDYERRYAEPRSRARREAADV